MMNEHRHLKGRLDHLLDGDLPDADRIALEDHLAGCEECLAEVEALRELRDAARALPREVAPPRDLWPGIAARIAEIERPAAKPVIAVDFASPRRAPLGRVWVLRIAASVALVAASSGLTAWLLRGAPADTLAVLPAERAQPLPSSATLAFASAEAEYDRAIATLSAELEARRGQLAPETVRTVEESLAIVDAAIAEARAALQSDPSNTQVPLILSDVYRKKVDLLQLAVQLTART